MIQEIVNGDHTQNGLNATSHATEDLKTAPEFCSKLPLTEEWTALDNQPNSGIAICMDALVKQLMNCKYITLLKAFSISLFLC